VVRSVAQQYHIGAGPKPSMRGPAKRVLTRVFDNAASAAKRVFRYSVPALATAGGTWS
jgi:hypothetical protein